MQNIPTYMQMLLPPQALSSNLTTLNANSGPSLDQGKTKLIYLANSGWLGKTPQSIINNDINSAYIKHILDLPIPIPTLNAGNTVTTNSSSSNNLTNSVRNNVGGSNVLGDDGDFKIDWVNDLELIEMNTNTIGDENDAVGFYYGGDIPSDDTLDQQIHQHVQGRDRFIQLQMNQQQERQMRQQLIQHDDMFNDNNNNSNNDSIYNTGNNTDTINNIGGVYIPTKFLPHMDVAIGSNEVSLIKNENQIVINNIHLKSDCVLVTNDSAHIKNKTILSPAKYSLKSSILSIPRRNNAINGNNIILGNCILNQNVPIVESNDLNKSLNSNRKLMDEDMLFLTFLTDNPLPPHMDLPIYYYEIKVDDNNGSNGISLGFVNLPSTNNVSPPPFNSKECDAYWINDDIKSEKNCIYWEAKTGMIFYHQKESATQQGQRFNQFVQLKNTEWCSFANNDIIGLGVDFIKGEVFGVKNGIKVGSVKNLTMIDNYLNNKSPTGAAVAAGRIYPMVTMSKNNKLTFNLGASTFIYDIINHIQDKKDKVMEKINKSKIKPFNTDLLGEINDELSMESFNEEIILGYLIQKGFVNASKALFEQINERRERGRSPTVGQVEWQPLCSFKSRIKQLLQKDSIDDLMQLITIKYPNFWYYYPMIEFKLLCFKYIKMIEPLHKNKNQLRTILSFGKLLQRKFSYNAFFIKELDEISQLIAYDNPKDCTSIWIKFVILGKEKILESLMMSLSEINGKSCLTGFDLGLLRMDLNLDILKQSKNELNLIDIFQFI